MPQSSSATTAPVPEWLLELSKNRGCLSGTSDQTAATNATRVIVTLPISYASGGLSNTITAPISGQHLRVEWEEDDHGLKCRSEADGTSVLRGRATDLDAVSTRQLFVASSDGGDGGTGGDPAWILRGVELRGTLPEVFNLCILGGRKFDTDFIFRPVPHGTTVTSALNLPFRSRGCAA